MYFISLALYHLVVIFRSVKSTGKSRNPFSLRQESCHAIRGRFKGNPERFSSRNPSFFFFLKNPLALRVVALCRMYEDLTNCTFQVALGVGCFWPNQMVDRFFMHIHQSYFHDCALTGRLIHDPPPSILAPFIAVPVLVTLLMAALVVWRSKRTKGVL